MAVRIAVVHDDPEFLAEAAASLASAGFEVCAFTDPIDAVDAIKHHRDLDLLITRVNYGSGKLHGLALARMARYADQRTRVLFVGQRRYLAEAEGIGAFVVAPCTLGQLCSAVDEILMPNRQPDKG
jgi:DNA-binding response OmpR family regulator